MKRLPDFDLEDWHAFTGRSECSIDPSAADTFHGKRVLVTGAGGSIGSALSKVIARFEPAELVLLDHSELGLYEIGRSFLAAAIGTSVRFVIGSVTDPGLLEHTFRDSRPQIVFHAAACKHVPLLETNPFAAAKTNALGSQLIANVARAHGAEQCILLSTDKAVEPTSIMGATKRIAECVFLAREGGAGMKIVRLGNVLGSSGSVVPVFREQIRKGQPITVTHPKATRYFLTLSEAVASLVQSASPCISNGLLIARIATPLSITNLARYLIQGSSYEHKGAIVFSGLRPGDKITERMTSDSEVVENSSSHELVQVVHTAIPDRVQVDRGIDCIRDSVSQRQLEALLRAIGILVPEYVPSSVLQQELSSEWEQI